MNEAETSAYYLAISGVQKAVRRGLPETALHCAKAAHSLDPTALFKRLWVILFEDCGRSFNALKTFYEWRGNAAKWEEIENLVLMMALNEKSRDCHFLSNMWKEGIPVKTASVLRSVEPDAITFMSRVEKKGLTTDIYWDHEFEHESDWVLELASRAGTYVREKHWTAGPYFHRKGYENKITDIGVDEVDAGDLIEGVIPIAAMDMHNRPGLEVYRLVQKRMLELGYCSPGGVLHDQLDLTAENLKDLMQMWAFDLEGGALRNMSVGQVDYLYYARHTWNAHEWDMWDDLGREVFNGKVKPLLDEARLYLSKTKYKDVVGLIVEAGKE